MNAIVLLLVSLAILFIAYVTYGSWLAKQWGVDEKIITPAHTLQDGNDYVPAKAPVLLGHHFASIAGAGPINGPIQAAIFGWVPVTLWVLLGGIFFGAVQDFSSLFASIRHDGKSIGFVVEKYMGESGKKLFLVFSWLTLVLVVAAFADIVGGTFNGFVMPGKDVTNVGEAILSNGATATASLLFIVLSVGFGFFVYRRNANLLVSTIIGVILLVSCIFLGLQFPILMPKNFWMLLIFGYIFIASVTPVWILLQPRDYLNSFLLYGMMILAIVGIIASNPTVNLPAFTSMEPTSGQYLFPMLFITVACGAISGFHSLVGSGTTAKQLNTEKDAKLIGYGGMLIECGLAIIALICVGALFTAGGNIATDMPKGTPAIVFARAISGFTTKVGLPESTIYTVVTLAISAFALTSLDTATRLARYLWQEFFVHEGEDVNTLPAWKKILVNPYVATLITVAFGGLLALNGYQNIWPLFGAANQLLAGLALLIAAVWLGHVGKNNKMFFIPMVFMLLATLTALVLTVKNNVVKLLDPAVSSLFMREGLQVIFASLLFVLAIVVAYKGFKVLVLDNKKAHDKSAKA